jgi:hypothetical protein
MGIGIGGSTRMVGILRRETRYLRTMVDYYGASPLAASYAALPISLHLVRRHEPQSPVRQATITDNAAGTIV